MRLHICAVGRLRSGPERLLIDDYLQRLDRSGRPLGLSRGQEIEVEDKKGGGMGPEAQLLRKALPSGARLVTLDERGELLPSPDFARRLAKARDDGLQDLAFVIGGADGIDPGLRAEADWSLSFGAMVWPHALARAMLAEQLYRAATILGGGPYHRA